MIGQTISHYRVTHQIGAGGMGVVYGGEDDRLGRQVALKFIPDEMVRDRQAIERFRVEARTASALNHPNICTVYDIGEHHGKPFIVMEWMKGQTLQDRLLAGMLKVPQIVDFGIEIADALDAAHEQGIVHRDIKPANIFVTDRGHVKVMDFGLAKLLGNVDLMEAQTRGVEALTQPGMTLGTSSYMSPEQAAGDTLDGRSDLFSLGIVLYECATGRRPFVGNSARAVLSAILHTAPMAPGLFNEDLPQRLQQVISDCLEKDPDLRYQNAASLRADLKRVKRDLESGRTASVTLAADSRTTSASPNALTEVVTTPAVRVPDATVAITQPVSAPIPARRRLTPIAIGAVVAAGVVAAAVGYFRPASVSETQATSAAPAPDAYVQSRSEAAERSLQAKQYRDAQRYADEVLSAAPDDAKAAAIREQAGAQLRQAAVNLEQARKMIRAGDVRAAVRALDDARTIDPLAPGLLEVSQLLADRFQARAEAAELELQRSRAAAPAQRAAALPAPSTSAVPSKSVSAPQAPVEPSRDSPPPAPAAAATPPPVPAPAVEPPKRIEPAESAIIKPAPSPVALPERKTAAEAVRETDDDAAIRAVVATYARAIESKDLALFRSIKPNLEAEEERRIREGFRAVTSQKVNITITSITRDAQRATVQLTRQDVIEAGGRRQASESRQTMTLIKGKGAWVIVEIGR
jgi:hypothetical protein